MAEVNVEVGETKEQAHTTSTLTDNNNDIESGSGSENGEKPVREKLKKTDLEEETDEKDQSATEINGTATGEGAAKLKKKRSYEDLVHEEGLEVDTSLDDAHARKKTRETLASATKETAEVAEAPEVVLEDDEDAKQSDIEGDKILSTPPSSSNEAMEDVDDPTKVRKKRSAEDMSDVPKSPRSPKIAATDAERVRRSSPTAGSDRDSKSVEPESQDAICLSQPRSIPQDDLDEAKRKAEIASPTTSGFANTSAVSPFASLSPEKTKESAADNQPQTSASAFVASGFAALSGTTSPFSALAKEKSSTPGNQPQTSPSAFSSSGFAALSGSGSAFGAATEKLQSAAAKTDASPFATATSQTGFGFGAKPFGSGFGSGFGAGQKLSSFAAPVGDTKLGSTPAAKPFGAPEASEDGEDDASDDENEDGEDNASTAFGDPTTESSSQFKVQDDHITGEENEQTSFLANAKLYQYSGAAGWVERGTGPFKLNYTIVDASNVTGAESGFPISFDDLTPGQAEIDARFIMRNAATHKAIVNAKIFKEMQVGDRAGGEPEKKNEIFFSAYVDDGITPFLLRMGKKDDSKELYDQVKKIQRLL